MSRPMTWMRHVLLAGLGVLLIAAGCAAVVAGAGFDRAVEAFEKGDYRTAIARLEESITRGSDSARVRTLLGWSLYRLGDETRARTEFERALRLDPRDPNAYYAHEGLGWIAYHAREYDRALAAFAEALRLSPGYHNAQDGLGWTYLARDDLVRAEASFGTALARAPGDLDAQRGLGFVAYHRGDWTRAIERFREVVRQNEGDSLSRSALGWCLYYAGDLTAARQAFTEVARREPAWADPHLGLGWVAERQGQAPEARASFRAAIARSAVYVATGVPGAALTPLLVSRPDWVDLWRDLAWSLYHQRAFALAETEWRRLLQQHPDDPDALRGRGFALYALRRYAEAIAPLEGAVAAGAALPPVHERVEIPGTEGLHAITSDATSTLGWTHYRMGNFSAALPLFREVTGKHADWPDSWAGLGWTLLRLGDRDGAERAFRRSLLARPGYPDAVNGLAMLGKRPS